MKNYLAIYCIICLMLSCKKDIKNSSIEQESMMSHGLEKVLEKYIDDNPIKPIRGIGKSSLESGFSYPSYHLFFSVREKDTILELRLFPHLTKFYDTRIKNNDSIYEAQILKGFFFFKNKNPILIFDRKNYSEKFISEEKLIKSIPDSLRLNLDNFYKIKDIKRSYRLIKGDFFLIAESNY